MTTFSIFTIALILGMVYAGFVEYKKYQKLDKEIKENPDLYEKCKNNKCNQWIRIWDTKKTELVCDSCGTVQ